jgi:MFS family permease
VDVFDDWDDVANPKRGKSPAVLIGAVVGFFLGAVVCAILAWIAARTGAAALWYLAVLSLPLGLLGGIGVGALVRFLRRPKPRKTRSHKRRKTTAGKDE